MGYWPPRLKARRRLVSGVLPLLGGILCLIGTASGATLKERFVVSKWESKDGLPENSATSIAWTPDGFMWIGTFNGLVRFDGVEMEVYDSRNTSGLHESSVVNLHCDSEGRLWVGTGSGVVSLKDGEWRRHGEDSPWDGAMVRFFVEGGAVSCLQRGSMVRSVG